MSPLLPRSDRLRTLIEYVQQQGLQPGDFMAASGRDALVAIAQMLPTTQDRAQTETRVRQPRAPKTILVDSLSFYEYKTAKELQLLHLYGGKRLYASKPRPVPVKPQVALTDAWQRVLQHAYSQPR